MRRLERERAELARLRAANSRASGPEVPETLAERITRFLQIKYIEDHDQIPPTPFDWPAAYERVRRMLLERGDDPDRPYS